MSWNRRHFLQFAAAASAATSLRPALGAQSAASGKPRNIVFILSDDHRFDYIGAMGHPWLQGKTPHMDRMVNQGIHFENAFVTTSLCSPSRASILTGQYIYRHGVVDNNTALPSQMATFPQVLQANGYRTGFIGKWHMGGDSDDPRPGFHHWYSFRGQGEYQDPMMNRNGKRAKAEGYVSDVLTNEAITFMRDNQSQPFCLYLSHKNVHGPFEPAPRHKNVFADKEIPYPETYPNIPENREGKPEWVLKQRNSWHGADGAQAIPGGFEKMYRGYCEGILAIDESIGQVRAELERLGLAENTLLIYMGDNGYLNGEHGLIDKRVMYDPSIRVPLLMECPALTRQPVKVPQLVINTDIAPTVLDYAGVAAPAEMQGASALPLIRKQSANWRDAFLYVYLWENVAPHTPTIMGLRTERYSFIKTHGVWDRYELYDIQADPLQKNNLLARVYNGMKYGTMERYIQDPALKKLYLELDKRLTQEIERMGGLPLPRWNQTQG